MVYITAKASSIIISLRRKNHIPGNNRVHVAKQVVRQLVAQDQIVGCESNHLSPSSLMRVRKNSQTVRQFFINLHNRGLIATSIAIIGCTEYCYNISLLTPVITYTLMTTVSSGTNQRWIEM